MERTDFLESARDLSNKYAGTDNGIVVTLSAIPNPDFNEHGDRAPSQFAFVPSLTMAVTVCLSYALQHKLGGGNWTGGDVFNYGQCIAKISYNNRIWCVDPYDDSNQLKQNFPENAMDLNSAQLEDYINTSAYRDYLVKGGYVPPLSIPEEPINYEEEFKSVANGFYVRNGKLLMDWDGCIPTLVESDLQAMLDHMDGATGDSMLCVYMYRGWYYYSYMDDSKIMYCLENYDKGSYECYTISEVHAIIDYEQGQPQNLVHYVRNDNDLGLLAAYGYVEVDTNWFEKWNEMDDDDNIRTAISMPREDRAGLDFVRWNAFNISGKIRSEVGVANSANTLIELIDRMKSSNVETK